MPSRYKNVVETFLNPKLRSTLNNTKTYSYHNLTMQWCRASTNCNLMIESGRKIFRQIEVLNRIQNALPPLGDFIFGLYDRRESLKSFYDLTTNLVSGFYENQVQNISLIDLPAFGAIGKSTHFLRFHLEQVNETKDSFDHFNSLLYDMVLNTSLNHPCNNKMFENFCNIQTNNIMAKNLEKFFKIMLISSTISMKNNLTDVINNFLSIKGFRDQFRVLNTTKFDELQPKYPISFCNFKRVVSESDENDNGCETMTPVLTPLGLCSSFNALSHSQIYADTEHSNMWTKVIDEKEVTSKLFF